MLIVYSYRMYLDLRYHLCLVNWQKISFPLYCDNLTVITLSVRIAKINVLDRMFSDKITKTILLKRVGKCVTKIDSINDC